MSRVSRSFRRKRMRARGVGLACTPAARAVSGTMASAPGAALLRATRAVSRCLKFSYTISNAARSIANPVGGPPPLAASTIRPCASLQLGVLARYDGHRQDGIADHAAVRLESSDITVE